MDPEKIRFELDHPFQGVQKTSQRIARKPHHELNAYFEAPIPEPINRRNGLLGPVAPVRKGEDLILHGLFDSCRDYHVDEQVERGDSALWVPLEARGASGVRAPQPPVATASAGQGSALRRGVG